MIGLQDNLYLIVDVGCIECGEQTEVLGMFDSEADAKAAMYEACRAREIDEWHPRGGMLEFVGLHGQTETTYCGGIGYFDGGQRALELHVFPARSLALASADSE